MIYRPQFFIETNAYKSIATTKDLTHNTKVENNNIGWGSFSVVSI